MVDTIKFYPTPGEVDIWVESIWEALAGVECSVEMLPQNGFTHSLGVNHMQGRFQYLKFQAAGMDSFYGYWQPALAAPAPLLFHVPGYGAEMSTHPELVAAGYNLLHVSPLGYATPEGPDEAKQRDGEWPVLPDTVVSAAQKGYKLWLLQCLIAIRWAMNQAEVLKDRVSFFGTSQGGGGALLLGSLFQNRGVRCVAADLPFLTNFPLAGGRGAYHHATRGLRELARTGANSEAAGWRALGFIDTLSHAHRLKIPVLLTAGGQDDVCPPETVASLYQILPGTRSLTYLDRGIHRYSPEFIPLAAAWFRLYA